MTTTAPLAAVAADVVACERCPRLRGVVPPGRKGEGEALRGRDVLGPSGARLRRPARAALHRRAGAGRARRQPHRPGLHRRSLRRLPVRGAASGRLRQPADLGARAATACGCAIATSRRSPAARRRPTSPSRRRSLHCREYLLREWRLLRRRARRARAGQDRAGRLHRAPCASWDACRRGGPSPSATACATTSATGCRSSLPTTRRSRTRSPASSLLPGWTGCLRQSGNTWSKP